MLAMMNTSPLRVNTSFAGTTGTTTSIFIYIKVMFASITIHNNNIIIINNNKNNNSVNELSSPQLSFDTTMVVVMIFTGQ